MGEPLEELTGSKCDDSLREPVRTCKPADWLRLLAVTWDRGALWHSSEVSTGRAFLSMTWNGFSENSHLAFCNLRIDRCLRHQIVSAACRIRRFEYGLARRASSSERSGTCSKRGVVRTRSTTFVSSSPVGPRSWPCRRKSGLCTSELALGWTSRPSPRMEHVLRCRKPGANWPQEGGLKLHHARTAHQARQKRHRREVLAGRDRGLHRRRKEAGCQGRRAP